MHLRRLAGFPARCHRARSAGGLFSVALSVTPCSGDFTSPVHFAPWRYQARCPLPSGRLKRPKSCPHLLSQLRACALARGAKAHSSSPALASLRRWCPDFPPVYPEAPQGAEGFTLRPAAPTANQRSPGSPASFHYTATSYGEVGQTLGSAFQTRKLRSGFWRFFYLHRPKSKERVRQSGPLSNAHPVLSLEIRLYICM